MRRLALATAGIGALVWAWFGSGVRTFTRPAEVLTFLPGLAVLLLTLRPSASAAVDRHGCAAARPPLECPAVGGGSGGDRGMGACRAVLQAPQPPPDHQFGNGLAAQYAPEPFRGLPGLARARVAARS